MSENLPSWRWLLRRLFLALPVVVGVTALTFTLIHLAPGDPIYMLAGDGGSPSYYADMRAKYGLDRSLGEQFLRYARAVATGDLGYSFMFQSPVLRLLLEHSAASLLLGLSALAVATVGGFASGTLAAVMLEALQEPYVRALSARGLSYRRIVRRHVARIALVPVTALVGQHAAQVVASAALTEALFGWPGIGYLVLHASLHRDYPLVTAAFILISSSVVFFNAIADAACAWLDPRIRLT
ncbi:MAG: ABC transporter permease [Acidobacteria bacterium]|nr:ABC transporter permease [Acidobacteriota bacterium]